MNLYNNIIEKSKQQGIDKLEASLLIIKDNKLLIKDLKKENTLGFSLETPTGIIKQKDSLDQSIRKILKSETNLELKQIEKYLHSFDYVTPKGERIKQNIFVVKTNEEKIKNNYKWLKIEELNEDKFNDELIFALSIYYFNKEGK